MATVNPNIPQGQPLQQTGAQGPLTPQDVTAGLGRIFDKLLQAGLANQAEVATLRTDAETVQSLAETKGMAALSDILTSTLNEPKLPPINSALIQHFQEVLRKNPNPTKETLEKAVASCLQNIEDSAESLALARKSYQSGQISAEEFQELSNGIVEDVGVRSAFKELYTMTKEGVTNPKTFDSARNSMLQGLKGSKGSSSAVSAWMTSSSLATFIIFNDKLMPLYLNMIKNDSALSAKMKEAMKQIAKEIFEAAMKSTEAAVEKLQAEALSEGIGAIGSFVNAGLSFGAALLTGKAQREYAKEKTAAGADDAKLKAATAGFSAKTQEIEQWKGMATGITSSATEAFKSVQTLRKAGFEQTQGYQEAQKNLLEKLFQSFQDSASKIQEGLESLLRRLDDMRSTQKEISAAAGRSFQG